MATGNMIIASNVGGIPEVLQDGETGILVGPDNPTNLAQAILNTTKLPSQIRYYAEKGRAQVTQYRYEDFICSYLNLYKSMLAVPSIISSGK
jgi:glycosyltransferase involved in cell wall biosynthesis